MLFEGFRRLLGPKSESGIEIKKNEIPKFLGNLESRKGDTHDENEDSLILDHAHQLYAVFDGVSGVEGGKIASETAKNIFEKKFTSLPFELSENEAVENMRSMLQEAHSEICKIKVAEMDSAPGTTATILKFFRNPQTKKLYGVVGNVGDSRLYQISRGIFRRITEDHNKEYQENMDRQGKKDVFVSGLKIVDAKTKGVEDILDTWGGTDFNTPDGTNVFAQSKRRNVITSSLGVTNSRPNYVDVVIIRDIFPGDRFLLTSDGIHDNLTTSEIRTVLEETSDAQKLVEAAYKRSLEIGEEGGNLRAKPDDMTAVCLEVDLPSKEKALYTPSNKKAA